MGLEFWDLHRCVASSAGGEGLALGFQVSRGLWHPGPAQPSALPPSHPLRGGESGVLAHQLRSQCPLSFSPSGTLGSQELRLRRGCVCVCVAVWLCVCVCVSRPPHCHYCLCVLIFPEHGRNSDCSGECNVKSPFLPPSPSWPLLISCHDLPTWAFRHTRAFRHTSPRDHTGSRLSMFKP